MGLERRRKGRGEERREGEKGRGGGSRSHLESQWETRSFNTGTHLLRQKSRGAKEAEGRGERGGGGKGGGGEGERGGREGKKEEEKQVYLRRRITDILASS